MPIILPGGSGGSSAGATYTAQDIINGTSQDLRNQLPNNSTILLDYADRIHKSIIRSSRWPFMLSDAQQFITEQGVTDYWIGATSSNPQGTVDTGLNLLDVFRIQEDSVLDRSNNQQLFRTSFRPPNYTTFEFPDGQSRQLRPTNFAHENYGSLLKLYPAPNNQNTYQPTAGSPICVTTAGGALANRTYSVRYTIIDSAGNESNASGNPTSIFVSAGQLLKVKSPNFPIPSSKGVQYISYKVYASAIQNNEVLQSGGSPIVSGTDFTESTSGLVTNTVAYPTVNNLTQLTGYLIEFRYYKQRLKLTSGTTTLMLPDDYKDILIAGVNWLGYLFLKLPTDAQMWSQIYHEGIREIVRDKNQWDAENFIKPDVATQVFPVGLIPGFITGN